MSDCQKLTLYSSKKNYSLKAPASRSRGSSSEQEEIIASPTKRASTKKDHIVIRDQAMSSIASVETYRTQSTLSGSVLLGPLQAKDDLHAFEPVDDYDPGSFDLVAPPTQYESGVFSLEKRSEQLFSREHLQIIFAEPSYLLKFSSFLSKARPQSVAVLIYYLDALKALKAISYANAIAEALEPLSGQEFTNVESKPTINQALELKAASAFDAMVREDLPAFVTSIYIKVVTESISRRITGTLAPHLREASEGLAEVFCLTDPSRPDNPIVFASEGSCGATNYFHLKYSIVANVIA